jgi:ureidoglycolate dehydrogenase (NAD+)
MSPDKLSTFATAALVAAGASAGSAEATSRAMMHASLHGVESHGIRLLPWYCEQLRTGLVKGAPVVRVDQTRRAAALVDAGGGFGHLPTYRAMDTAVAAARDCGIGMASVVNSAHFGAAGPYALAAAEAGFIGFVTCNSGAFVTPFNGSSPVHGTNPIAFAAPNAGGDPFLLDMATSSIPWNRVLRARTEGLAVPPETAIGEDGAFTEDAEAARAGPAGRRAFRLQRRGAGGRRRNPGRGIDPTLFLAGEQFTARLRAYLDGLAALSTPERPVYAAGGPQWIARRERQAMGIPILPGLQAELESEALRAMVAFH